MIQFTADQIIKACTSPRSVCGGLYETANGSRHKAVLASEVSAALRDAGYRRVGRIDEFDLRDAGLTIAQAQYVGGARPTGRFVSVVILPA